MVAFLTCHSGTVFLLPPYTVSTDTQEKHIWQTCVSRTAQTWRANMIFLSSSKQSLVKQEMIFGIDSYFKGIDMHLYQVSNYTDLLRALKRIVISWKEIGGAWVYRINIRCTHSVLELNTLHIGKHPRKRSYSCIHLVLHFWKKHSHAGKHLHSRGQCKSEGSRFFLTSPNKKHDFLIIRHHSHDSWMLVFMEGWKRLGYSWLKAIKNYNSPYRFIQSSTRIIICKCFFPYSRRIFQQDYLSIQAS